MLEILIESWKRIECEMLWKAFWENFEYASHSRLGEDRELLENIVQVQINPK